ncbi:MAG: type I-D CRISPR-associated helicase Cas3' [Bacteroidales bacterium]|nr:type I-D CRISPR-associated helicase Cas3' [Bacteroidales bacterium]
MKTIEFSIKPQYVKQTDTLGRFPDGKGGFNEYPLHLIQKRMKEDFEKFPDFTIITAPTGTGKSYAFPFPVLNSKNKGGFGGLRQGKRGLIVLPTNALIDELHEKFTDTFKEEINIDKLTGKHITELQKDDLKKGTFHRFTKMLEISQQNDLVITNPDIINYAMHGGYHQKYWGKTGRKEFHNFLQVFDYIIFDEYHLYDESQIANILTLTFMHDIFFGENHKIKYLFVSATPESGLKEILQDFNFEFEEIIEDVVENSHKARVIHGKLDFEIYQTSKFTQLIESKYDEIENEIKAKRKVLIIFDTIAELFNFYKLISDKFPNYKIVKSTGYSSQDENQNEEIKTANIILATNKAEVGVNYDVEYAIMQPGKFYRNFVQRFGRVSRGDLSGKIVVAIKENVTFNKLKKLITEKELNYYDFLEVAKEAFQSKKLYSENIPAFIGEYMWCIKNNIYQKTDSGKRIGNYNTLQVFINRINELELSKNPKYFVRYNLFQSIDKHIWALKQKHKTGITVEAIDKWWENYKNTYLTFRDNSKIVEIYDEIEKKHLSYSLEWILQNKVILEIKTIKKDNYEIEKYTVGEIKERDKDLQYEISTIPTFSDTPCIAHYDELFSDKKIKILFQKNVEELKKKHKKGWNNINTELVNFCDKLLLLSNTFNRKRLKIDNIISNNKFM